MRRAVRKSSGVWVCMAPRKEKSAQENEVERGCVGSLLSWITLRLESFASYIHASYAGQEKESCINKIRKNYENLLNISVYPVVTPRPWDTCVGVGGIKGTTRARSSRVVK